MFAGSWKLLTSAATDRWAHTSRRSKPIRRDEPIAPWRAPSADASVKVAGSATGIDARTAVRTRGMISASGSLRKCNSQAPLGMSPICRSGARSFRVGRNWVAFGRDF